MKTPGKVVDVGGQIVVFLLFLLSLISCGGNGDNTNNPPLAAAGVDQNQPRGTTISLDGRKSSDPDGDLLTYEWMLTSSPVGSTAALSDTKSPMPTFVADILGEYVISLVVSDGLAVSSADEVRIVVNTVPIYENDFSQNTLNDFLVGEQGDAQVSIDQGQLRIDPGEGYLNRGYVALNLSDFSAEYSASLIDNPSKIVWAFNVSNIDGTTCGMCNNLFGFNLFSDPDPSATNAFGYALTGGGYVGSRAILDQRALGLSPFGSISNTIVDLDDGLETLPTAGSFKLAYYPGTSLWELYYEESTTPLDPRGINTLVGSGINTEFASKQLPYLILWSYNSGTVFFDNLSVMIEFSI